jgi:hypothetical protein
MPNTIIKFVVENKSLLTTVIAIAGFVLSLFQFIHFGVNEQIFLFHWKHCAL